MGFFDSKPKEKTDDRPQAAPMVTRPVEPRKPSSSGSTRIGPQMTIDGLAEGNEDLVIDGTVKGKVVCQGLVTVGKTGVIRADVTCNSITIEGDVFGNIVADSSVTIESTGRLTGDITAKTFINQPGGFFEGYSHMLTDEKKPNVSNEPKEKGKNK
ncbi:MAG: polymer-forming cytoskeletal protein [Acidobacteria bacterium]|nr:polymer-forming cytoskeletal protein [Acidobacteriota bacterium]